MGDAKRRREAAANGIKVKLPKPKGPKLFADTCTYCMEPKMCNQDHVFSDGLFPSIVHKTALIKVPACLDCNNKLSALEGMFRVWMVMGSPQKNEPETVSVFQRAKRSIDNDNRIKEALKRCYRQVYSNHPITGAKHITETFIPDKPVLADLAPIFWKISAGLYRHRLGKLIEGTTTVQLIIRDQQNIDPPPQVQRMRKLVTSYKTDPPGWQIIDINGKEVVKWLFCPLEKPGIDYETQGLYAFEFHKSNVIWFVQIGSDVAQIAGELGH